MFSGLPSKADMAARFIPKQTVSNRMYEYYDLSSSQRRSGQLATWYVERCDTGRVLPFYRSNLMSHSQNREEPSWQTTPKRAPEKFLQSLLATRLMHPSSFTRTL